MFKRLLFIALALFTVSLSAQENRTYTVQSGETITSICKDYGITKDELIKLNPTVKNYVYTGQVLNIPSNAKQLSEEKAPASTVSGVNRTSEPVQANNAVVEKNTYSSKQFNPRSDWELDSDGNFEFVATNSFGLYLKPDELSKIDDLHYLGLSIDCVDIGTRFNLSKALFIQGTVSMQFDYSISWIKQSNGSGDYKVTSVYRNSDINSTFGIPIHLGVNIGPVTLRGGVYGRIAWLGAQTTFSKITTKDNEIENSTMKYYKEIKGENDEFDRITYGLSFSLTVRGKDYRSRGISFKTVTSEHSKESMKLISYVVYY